MTKGWLHRPLPQAASIRRLARLRGKLVAACRLGNTTRDVPSFFIDFHVSTKGTWHHSPSLREPYRPGRSYGSQRLRSTSGSSARKAVPHDSLSSTPPRQSDAVGRLAPALSNTRDTQVTEPFNDELNESPQQGLELVMKFFLALGEPVDAPAEEEPQTKMPPGDDSGA